MRYFSTLMVYGQFSSQIKFDIIIIKNGILNLYYCKEEAGAKETLVIIEQNYPDILREENLFDILET